jgi:(+)-trans-carveol dehydrogenase
MGRLDGKVALITGAAKGQGRAHAVRMAEEGADIVAVDLCKPVESINYASGTPDDLKETAALVEERGRRVIARAADVRSQEQLDTVVTDARDALGVIDVVVSNAGIANFGATWELTDRQFFDVIETNLGGAWHTVKATVPSMIEAGKGGSVIFVSSTAGLRGGPGMAHYAASKHGIQGLMLSLANELGPHNIRVNTVNPGVVNTEMAMNPDIYRAMVPDRDSPTAEDVAPVYQALALLPIPWAEPEDISNAIIWLASAEARFVSGVNLAIDGGQLARA